MPERVRRLPWGERRGPLFDTLPLAAVPALPAEAWRTVQRKRRWPLRAAVAGLIPDAVRLGGKREPAWNATVRTASAEALRRLAPRVTTEAAGERSHWVDLDRIQRAALALPDRPDASAVAPFDVLQTLALGPPR